MKVKTPKRSKDPVAIKIGNRIKQARKMAEISTQAKLQAKLPDWTSGRVGFLEAGFTIPHPDEIQAVAKVTHSSPCWIMFGIGPIRSAARDVQAIRHQNLVYVCEQQKENREFRKFIKAITLTQEKLNALLENPFAHISDRLARLCEKAIGQTKGWFDEQHIETDVLSSAYPDDIREMMSIYSNLEKGERERLLAISRCFLD